MEKPIIKDGGLQEKDNMQCFGLRFYDASSIFSQMRGR